MRKVLAVLALALALFAVGCKQQICHYTGRYIYIPQVHCIPSGKSTICYTSMVLIPEQECHDAPAATPTPTKVR